MSRYIKQAWAPPPLRGGTQLLPNHYKRGAKKKKAKTVLITSREKVCDTRNFLSKKDFLAGQSPTLKGVQWEVALGASAHLHQEAHTTLICQKARLMRRTQDQNAGEDQHWLLTRIRPDSVINVKSLEEDPIPKKNIQKQADEHALVNSESPHHLVERESRGRGAASVINGRKWVEG